MAAPEPTHHDSFARAVPDRFESFDLLIERIGETYRAHVAHSPVGQRPPIRIDPAGRRGAGGRFRRTVLPTAAIIAAGLSGMWIWRSGDPEVPSTTVPAAAVESESCPPPLGLTDLQFVKVGPGVIDLGDRKVTVEEAFCIGTKEVSRRDWLAVPTLSAIAMVVSRSWWRTIR